MPDVFVSYSAKDRDFVLSLARDLQAQGLDLWLDIWQTPEREPNWDEIKAGLQASSQLLLVVSPDSLAQDVRVWDELGYAKDQQKPIVSVVAREVDLTALPSDLIPQGHQITDFATLGYNVAFPKLVTTLNESLGSGNRIPWIFIGSCGLIVAGVVVVILGVVGYLLGIISLEPDQPDFLLVVGAAEGGDGTDGGSLLSQQMRLFAQETMRRNDHWEPYSESIDGVEMVLVPVGCFRLGNKRGEYDEKPEQEICFDKPFWIDKYEVTNAQFEQFNGWAQLQSRWTEPNFPRARLTWFEANAFCQVRGARLPTEIEWEYAARGPDGLRYPWGDKFEMKNGVFGDNIVGQLAEVGSKPAGASWVGAMDMSGNAWEWVSSIHEDYPYRADDGREDPTDLDSWRVLRGGSWFFSERTTRLTNRYRLSPEREDMNIGVRCARDLDHAGSSE